MRLSKRNVTYARHSTHAARMAHARGRKQFATYDVSAISPKPLLSKPVIIGIIAAIVVLLGVLLLCITQCSRCEVTIPDGQEVTTTIADGSSGKAIAQQFQDEQIVSSADGFLNALKSRGIEESLKPGTYTFTGPLTLDELIDSLVAGPVFLGDRLSVPEGSRIDDVANLVNNATDGRLSAGDFTSATSDASVYAAEFPFVADAGTSSLEGFLFPKTYDVLKNATVSDVVRQMLAQYKKETASLDYSYPASVGLTEYQTLILASIVEKEANAENMDMIASVFYNRLASTEAPTYGYLQSDATTAYVVGHSPSKAEVEADDPYSTYRNPGLPPTPICNPSLACLNAVCHPATTNYYFFYSYYDDDNNVQYAFSETNEDHIQAQKDHPNAA